MIFYLLILLFSCVADIDGAPIGTKLNTSLPSDENTTTTTVISTRIETTSNSTISTSTPSIDVDITEVDECYRFMDSSMDNENQLERKCSDVCAEKPFYYGRCYVHATQPAAWCCKISALYMTLFVAGLLLAALLLAGTITCILWWSCCDWLTTRSIHSMTPPVRPQEETGRNTRPPLKRCQSLPLGVGLLSVDKSAVTKSFSYELHEPIRLSQSPEQPQRHKIQRHHQRPPLRAFERRRTHSAIELRSDRNINQQLGQRLLVLQRTPKADDSDPIEVTPPANAASSKKAPTVNGSFESASKTGRDDASRRLRSTPFARSNKNAATTP